ncbi:MAG: APC family permease [Candidatus Abyssobacteria bacterium SURF_5]|uniref:APC family permease n=1 Tax=Abyssobacteria bacterium (strain SURF_5) TaxID=2093360 RepID=A0A3A4NN19_ABYX5|nr:MAG: APC family permease [Candidatus Abyssubacteria bacterium SURF_5]
MTTRANEREGVYFARKATGLVRELSAWHAFAFNSSFINIGLILIYSFLYIPSFHPGASMMLACILGAVAAIPMALINAMLASTYARSGGEYVYNSRIISPAVGFMSNWNMSIWILFYAGVSCVLFSQYGLSTLFRFIGVMWNSESLLKSAEWLSAPYGAFVVGSAVLLLIIIGSILNTRMMAQIQGWYFVIGLTSVALAIFFLLITSRENYTTNFNLYFGKITGQKEMLSSLTAKARENGYATAPFSLLATLLIFYWPANFLFWGNTTTYFGGEIKNARHSQMIGLIGSVVVIGFFAFLASVAFKKTVGFDTIGAINYLTAIGQGIGVQPNYAELAAAGLSSRIVGIIIILGLTYWAIAFAPLVLGAVTRNMLAWSLDRIAPEFLSRVSPRFHTPVYSLIVCGIICEISVYLYAYVPAFAFIVGLAGAFVTFLITALAAIILPYRKRQVFESSPVNWKIGKIPLITIFGIFAFLGVFSVQITALLDPYSGISIFPSTDAGYGAGIPFKMFLVNLAVLLSGLAIYILIKVFRRMQGINIEYAFRELPPE